MQQDFASVVAVGRHLGSVREGCGVSNMVPIKNKPERE